MEWLNYHHLYYFWRIAREGGLARAAEQLHLSHSTLSSQLRSLEEFFGGSLFERRGRRLVLTPLGEETASYADDIFRMGAELVDVARGERTERRLALRIGVVSSMPKSVAFRLLEPAISVPGYGSLVARQDRLEVLLEEMGAGRLHLVLSDVAPPEASAQRVFAHLLGESSLLLYGTDSLAKKYRKGFPASLDGAPVLLPTAQSALRRSLDRWFVQRGVKIKVAGEFDDAGLMRVAGAHGLGLLPVRSALRAEVEEGYGLALVGEFTHVIETYYVISLERRVRHPAVSALSRTHASVLVRRPPNATVEKKRRGARSAGHFLELTDERRDSSIRGFDVFAAQGLHGALDRMFDRARRWGIEDTPFGSEPEPYASTIFGILSALEQPTLLQARERRRKSPSVDMKGFGKLARGHSRKATDQTYDRALLERHAHATAHRLGTRFYRMIERPQPPQESLRPIQRERVIIDTGRHSRTSAKA